MASRRKPYGGVKRPDGSAHCRKHESGLQCRFARRSTHKTRTRKGGHAPLWTSDFFGRALSVCERGGHPYLSTQQRAVVDTGVLAGVKQSGLAVFRGVPYAAPPVGALRWKAPQQPAAWTGVRDASKYGLACPQDDAHKEAWAQVGAQGEDCLFLNVWKPDGARKATVMVFLHGGGFTYGAAGVPL